MALSKDQVDVVVNGFVSILLKEIPVEEVILFGSYAHGAPQEHSDIDLAVVSDWFRDKTRMEGMQFLSRLAARYNTFVEAIPFTAEELRNPDKRSFLAGILRKGKRYHPSA
jgi:predicted nucleotidyltransferase